MRSRDVDGVRALTAMVAAVLLVLLAVEGATLLAMGTLLPVHIVVGLVLIPPILLKLVAVAWRFAAYYRGAPAFVAAGPPPLLLRILGLPLVLATLGLFGTGVALVALGRSDAVVGLHKASFIVWVGAMTIHVLGHAPRVLRTLLTPLPGTRGRIALVAASLVAGTLVAVPLLPRADHWQDRHAPGLLDER